MYFVSVLKYLFLSVFVLLQHEDIFEALQQLGKLVTSLNSGTGSQFNPARTCYDLKRDYPDQKDGKYLH